MSQEAEVRSWSVGQLKTYLSSNQVDHSSCVEKGELLSLAIKHINDNRTKDSFKK
jgi:hypothetical protein